MADIKKVIHHQGTFLNEAGHHSDATLLTYVGIEKWTNDDQPQFRHELRLRDCNATVTINLDGERKKDYSNSLRKIRKMVKQLSMLEKAYQKGYQIYKKDKAIYDKAEKERKAKLKAKKRKNAKSVK